MKDLLGKDVAVGDTVAVARLNYKSAYLRFGVVKALGDGAKTHGALVTCKIRGRNYGAWTSEMLKVDAPQ